MDRLFSDAPEGFVYKPSLLTPNEEAGLAGVFAELPFTQFEFHGYLGNRRTISYGWKYDFAKSRLRGAGDIPAFLQPVREKAAAYCGREASELVQVLVTEYQPGTVIGWHRDKDVFGEIVGISLLSSCRFRFRKRAGDKFERTSVNLEPRSGYILRGEVRDRWEHSIPPVDELRYSITFRTLR